MFLADPPPSPYDLKFRLLGIPVRVHPMFWFVTLLLGLGGSPKLDQMLLWMGAVFVSIVVHEMGHALAARAHGWAPTITLYGFGGLASYRPTYHSTSSRLMISAAGPAAGFVFAAAILAGLILSGHRVDFEWPPEGRLPFHWELLASRQGNLLVFYLLYVNIFWGLVNLLPIYPLDGGQIARELLDVVSPSDGLRQSLWLSLSVAAVIAVLAVVRLHDNFLAFFFGYLGYLNYTAIQSTFGTGRWGGYR